MIKAKNKGREGNYKTNDMEVDNPRKRHYFKDCRSHRG